MINHNDDTICAISTGLTPSGCGIIRISGNDTKNIVSSIFVNKNKQPKNIEDSHKVYYGFIYDKENDDILDEVSLITMYAPKSYTKEDVIEIQAHGGLLILKNILSLLCKKGCRIADSGEFTKRAFLNGRIDLSEAESVADIILSQNNYARIAAFKILNGALQDSIKKYREQILEATAYIEACLDDPEHMSIDNYKFTLIKILKNINNDLEKLILNFDNGKLIREGIDTAIIGKPNVGKSSFLNCLLNEDRAIVSDIAGTTRDTIKETINLKGITLNIIDTAGIRKEENLDEIERIGIKKATTIADSANLVILVLDNSADFNDNDNNLLYRYVGKKLIIILNKVDLNNSTDKKIFLENFFKDLSKKKNLAENFCPPILFFSAKNKIGLNELEDTIEKMFFENKLDFNNEIFISNERQLSSLKNALSSLKNVLSSIENNMPEDLLTIDLMDGYTHLSNILGEEINDDLINEIFSKFCMGK